LSGTFTPALGDLNGASTCKVQFNFGQQPFKYGPPG